MSLFSLEFLLLVTVSVLLYYLIPKRWQWIVLLVASYCFYLAGTWRTIVYLILTTVTTFCAGLLLERLTEKGKALSESELWKVQKKLVILVTLLINFGVLFMLKYLDYVWELLGQGQLVLGLAMPLGVSFYTFQSVGYVVDCYRSKYPAEKNLAKYALFVSFFPQLIQGPISRYDQLAPQLIEHRKCNPDDLKYGIQLMIWGYMKKIIIADRAAVVADTVFGSYQSYGGLVYMFAVLMYCIQLYCDFSGGIDIIRGTAKLYGIELAQNFARPIFATSLTDYWRRWHITLGLWMKDYVFYSMALSKPLLKLGKVTRRKIGGRLGKIIPTSVATFTIYFIIGIWHGASLRYIVFGFFNGGLITASLLLDGQFAAFRKKLGKWDKSGIVHLFRMVRTMAIVFVGRYLTRAPRLLVGLYMLKKSILSPCLYQVVDGTFLCLGLEISDYIVVFCGTVVLLIFEWQQEQGHELRKELETKPAIVQWLCILFPLLLIAVLGLMHGDYIQAAFIYQQY